MNVHRNMNTPCSAKSSCMRGAANLSEVRRGAGYMARCGVAPKVVVTLLLAREMLFCGLSLLVGQTGFLPRISKDIFIKFKGFIYLKRRLCNLFP